MASCIDLFIKGNLPGRRRAAGGPGSALGIFDGIDLDWEWPGSDGNVGQRHPARGQANFAALIQEFRTQLNAYGASVGRQYPLSAFLPADPAKSTPASGPASSPTWTSATVQGYDFYGPWQPQTNNQSSCSTRRRTRRRNEFSVDGAVNKLVALGAPANKLSSVCRPMAAAGPVCPTSTTGSIRTAPPPRAPSRPGIEDYDVLKNRPGTVFRDTTDGALYKYDGTTWWSYDDPRLSSRRAPTSRARPGRADDLVARR